MRAIISVSDKRNVVWLGRGLQEVGVEVFSTGGTLRALEVGGVEAKSVSTLTGFPEILGGRVKTLHPAVHGGILHRREHADDVAEVAAHGIAPIDIVVVNLYPFRETVAAAGVTMDDALENIDIGGPTMLRAAAKNFPSVLVVVDPDDYDDLINALRIGEVPREYRQMLAAKAFAHVAAYDSAIAGFLTPERFPRTLPLAFTKVEDLRYGENPHQAAAFYREEQDVGGTIAGARQLQGKALSYTNLLDADAALEIMRAFEQPTAVIIKHTNPCGLATADDLIAAHAAARSGDPVSAFGGIVGFNRPVDVQTARALGRYFYEIIVAPAFEAGALEILAAKTNLRLLEVALDYPRKGSFDLRRVSGGLLVQELDRATNESPRSWQTVTEKVPTEAEMGQLFFAWKACSFVKSNAIVLTQGETLVGMGAGQPSRVDSVELAVRKAGDRSRGSMLASDAFFPKADGVEAAARAGVVAIVQPGGSQGDGETIAAANAHGIAMVFTGRRHFRH
ncbi:MAG: bifunctional phosphoribosylaminoimidazolecarboxamide formyltransferase/IMP cyclohydrolase [Herpetosiphon sp.]